MNAYQAHSAGGQDAFVTKLTSAGAISYSTYLGGSSGGAGFPEMANTVAVNSSGEAFVGGMTSSVNFPAVPSTDSSFIGGYTDGFLTKFSSSGSLVFSKYWGGSGWDQVNGITLLPTGAIVVAGMTSSWDFPTLRAAQTSIVGSYDVFLSEFTPTGAMYWSTFWGGTGADAGLALASNGAGEILFGGINHVQQDDIVPTMSEVFESQQQ